MMSERPPQEIFLWEKLAELTTLVKGIAPRLSVSHHVLVEIRAFRASSSSSNWLQILPITVFVHCRTIASSNKLSLHNVAMP